MTMDNKTSSNQRKGKSTNSFEDAFLPARLNWAGLANNIFEMTAVPDTPLQMNM